jgi:hypothetical protein
MARKSIRDNKSVYQIAREEKALTRAQASELMKTISEDRIDKIERGVLLPKAEDILAMAKCYKRPDLCNYFCTHECQIGKENIAEVRMEDLSQIVLEAIAALNRLETEKNRFIEIAVDGEIYEDEYKDFARIQNELNNISMAVSSLQLWVDKTIAEGKINSEELAGAKKTLESFPDNKNLPHH